jgi:O-antigen/teichoic acid export membrane protein
MVKSRLLLNSGANLLGRLVAAGSNVIAAPIILHAIGREGFGVVAFSLSFWVLASLLDLGLAGTANRAFAQAETNGQDGSERADLLRTFEIIYWPSAAVIIVATFVVSGFVARDWLQLSTLHPSDAALVVSLIGLMLGLRFPVGLYSGVLYGLRRHVKLNVILGGVSAVRYLGGAALVVFVSPSVIVYSKWLALTALVEVLATAFAAWSSLGGGRSFLVGRFQAAFLAQHWRFSLVFAAAGAVGTLVGALDRIFLGKLVPAAELGLYGLLYAPAGALTMVSAALGLASFPEFAATTVNAITSAARAVFFRTQLLATSCIMGIVVPLAIHFRPVLRIWTRDASIARDGFLPGLILLSALAVSAIANPASMLLIASGRPRIVLLRNISALLVAGVSLALLIPRWGLSGAAVAVLITNILAEAFVLVRVAKLLVVNSLPVPIVVPIILAFILLCAANVVIAIVIDPDLLRVIMGGIVSAMLTGGLILRFHRR